MAGLIRNHDWAATPLGPIEEWPQELKCAVDVTLAAGFPMTVLWGDQYTQIYNDRYRDLMGDRNPAGLGQSVRECWPESWHLSEPIYKRVRSGETVTFQEALVPISRRGAREDAWFTFSYAPLRGPGREIEGILATIVETTEAIRARNTRLEDQERFNTLFQSLDEGFCVIEMLFDNAGHPVDYRFLDVNPAFERQTGLTDAVGKTMRELAPNHEQRWLDIYGRIALTGEPARFEDRAAALDRWYDVYAFRMGDPKDHHLAILFRDISERKRTEDGLQVELAAMNRLQELARHVLAETDLQVLLPRILDVAIELSAADLGTLQLYDPDSHSLRIVAHRNFDQAFLDRFAVMDASPNSICGKALQTGSPIEIDDVELGGDQAVVQAGRANGYRGVQSTPLTDSDGEPVGMISTLWRAPHRLLDRERRLIDICARLASVAIRHHTALSALKTSEEQLQLIVGNARDYAIFTLDLAGRVSDWREGAQAVFGYPRDAIISQSADTLFTQEDIEAGAPEKERAEAAETGKAQDFRWHVRQDGSLVFIEGVCTALHDADGKPTGYLKVGRDATDRHSAEERQRLLLFELQHRVRNILAMIRSIARRSAETVDTVEDYQQHLEGRITAMSRTQVLLTRAVGKGLDLQNVILDELNAQAAQQDRFSVSGPDVLLSPKAVEVLGLTIHELATNSVKYGVLASDRGRIDIRWELLSCEEPPRLRLVWSEQGMANVAPPSREGFGTTLITQRVPYELHGSGTIQFNDRGLVAALEFPLVDSPSILQTHVDLTAGRA